MAEFISGQLIPGLPEELGLECLTRLPYTAHCAASKVCRRWQTLLQSRDFYHLRRSLGRTRKLACLVQTLPGHISGDAKSGAGTPIYGVAVFDPAAQTWHRLDPIPKYPNGLPLFCQLAGCDGKLILIGGWDPVSYGPVTDVFVYDFTTRRWQQRESMPEKRSFFAAGQFEGRVYVAGGHDENKNALSSACVYDVSSDAWTVLPSMTEARDECEGIVIGRELWVVSGYGTEGQGNFAGSADVYCLDSGEWRAVEEAWPSRRCPKSAVGVGKDRRLISWAEVDPAVRNGACGVGLDGSRTLVCGSEYQGGAHGFYMAGGPGEGQNGKFVKVAVPEDFSRFVQSGCCVEI